MRLTRSAAPIGLVVLMMSSRIDSKDPWNDETFNFLAPITT